MGGLGGGGEEKKAVKTATGKIVYKRRLGIRIDMTPMVDIVFLLLIFYMVTTVFAMPQAMEVNLPDKDELLNTYWDIPPRQIECSVVMGIDIK